jgi:hypothetical protein
MNSKRRITLPKEPCRLEEINLPPDLAGALAGKAITVEAGSEEVFGFEPNSSAAFSHCPAMNRSKSRFDEPQRKANCAYLGATSSHSNEALKELTISRKGAKTQRRAKSTGLLIFEPYRTLRLCLKCFCSPKEYFTAWTSAKSWQGGGLLTCCRDCRRARFR